jgi:hypothetical protein
LVLVCCTLILVDPKVKVLGFAMLNPAYFVDLDYLKLRDVVIVLVM